MYVQVFICMSFVGGIVDHIHPGYTYDDTTRCYYHYRCNRTHCIFQCIVAAILDLEVTCILKTIFDGFIVSGMVKNIYIDSKIVTLSAIFMELCQF